MKNVQCKRGIALLLAILFLFGVQPGFAATTPEGDVNGDGRVGADDARLALRRSVDLETYKTGTRAFRACDLDGDGVVTAAESRQILRLSIGLGRFATAAENVLRWLQRNGKERSNGWICETGFYKDAVLSFMYTPNDRGNPFSISMLSRDGDPTRLGIMKFNADFSICCFNLELSKADSVFVKALYRVNQAGFTRTTGAEGLQTLQYSGYDRMTADAAQMAAAMIPVMLGWAEQLFTTQVAGVHVARELGFVKF